MRGQTVRQPAPDADIKDARRHGSHDASGGSHAKAAPRPHLLSTVAPNPLPSAL
ncbi:hypothetical protein PCE31107_01067 [Pandoraea cepalis]|uniref:Uncharacterized protein n=1 Tax=Pandoraea cepalis TaxID=2508294 RepID=A0A5E4SZ63_9BURK|nr:hypothetical protein PCE31107_01067 [Pandoraea cepalis]